jgi:hypothetical protein
MNSGGSRSGEMLGKLEQLNGEICCSMILGDHNYLQCVRRNFLLCGNVLAFFAIQGILSEIRNLI